MDGMMRWINGWKSMVDRWMHDRQIDGEKDYGKDGRKGKVNINGIDGWIKGGAQARVSERYEGFVNF